MTANPTPKTELREKLAAIEHERWADWQKWCHKVLRENCPSPELEKVLERWDTQIATPYEQLTDREKASDMEQVDRYWPLIDTYAAQMCREARINELMAAEKYASYGVVAEDRWQMFGVYKQDRLTQLKALSDNPLDDMFDSPMKQLDELSDQARALSDSGGE